MKSKSIKKLTAAARKGFSLIELLVVIAIIGIIAAIAIPNIAGLTGSANTATAQRNAQNIASVAQAARAAGWAPSGVKATDLPLLIDETTPVTGPDVPGSTFSAPMSNADANAASVYLDANLNYVSGGGQTATNL